MKKHQISPLEKYRRIFILSILLLTAAGFFSNWVINDTGFFQSLTTTLLTISPAAYLCWFEWNNRILEKAMDAVQTVKFLNVVTPVLLVLAGLEYGSIANYSMYLLICFMLCVYIGEASLADRHDDLLMFLLLDIVIFCSLSVYSSGYRDGVFTISVMSYLYFLRLIARYPKKDKNFFNCLKSILAFSVAIIFIHSCICKILSASQEHFLFGEECWNLMENSSSLWQEARWLPASQPNCRNWFGYELGIFAENSGLLAVILLLFIVAVMLWAGGNLAFRFDRKTSVLVWGCFVLLAVRCGTYLLQGIGFHYKLTSGLPFFCGNIPDRVLDYLLAAVVLQPLKSPGLAELDPFDGEFPVLEMEALMHLPRNKNGLAQIAGYVFDNQDRSRGWTILFRDFIHLMDANTLRILVLNADQLFETDYFRMTYPEFFRYCTNPENGTFPEEIKTQFYNNTFIGSRLAFYGKGTQLEEYLGKKEKLLIPPFFNRIGFEAFRGNQNLIAVSIPNTVEKIDTCAFEGCTNLEVAELRAGLKIVGPSAFANTSLKTAHLPHTLQRIENAAFSETALKEVRIPGSVSSVSVAAFSDCCYLQKVMLEEGVHYIEDHAFSGCESLEEITIPNSLRHIQLNAFSRCSLKKIHASEEWKAQHPDLLYTLIHPDSGW